MGTNELIQFSKENVEQIHATRARMEAVIHEVSISVNQRADMRMAKAQRDAAKFRDMAERFDRMRQDLTKVSFDHVGPVIVPLHRAARLMKMMSPGFFDRFDRFVAEHGDLVETAVQSSVRDFAAWASGLVDEIEPHYRAFVKSYEEGLQIPTPDLDDVSREWAVTDSDGLDDL